MAGSFRVGILEGARGFARMRSDTDCFHLVEVPLGFFIQATKNPLDRFSTLGSEMAP
jgi:hypothetical protein